jgi:hypothetical protein
LASKPDDDVLERRGTIGGERGERLRLAIEDVGHGVAGRGPGEGQAARGHLVQDDAKREQIAARIERHLEDPFGRHVVAVPSGRPGNGRSLEARPDRRRHPELPRQPEVEHLHVAVVAHHHVSRLDVAVHHARGRAPRRAPP